MSRHRRQIDWNAFWIREVSVLSLPTLIAVFTLSPGEYIHEVRLAVVLVVLVLLTLGNILWTMIETSTTNWSRVASAGADSHGSPLTSAKSGSKS